MTVAGAIWVLAAALAAPQDAPTVSYADALRALHRELGAHYPCFELKDIDWLAVGADLLPRAEAVTDDASFGRLCLEMVARLEDSHAALLPGACAVPEPPWPRYSPGLACLIDDTGSPVVYHVQRDSPADRAGIVPGMTLLAVNGAPATERLAARMADIARYAGYSSERCLRFDASRALARTFDEGAEVRLALRAPDGPVVEISVAATLEGFLPPRRPVPIPGIREDADVDWTRLDGDFGYLSVRRIRDDLVPRLDAAVGALATTRGLVIDVRANSGGGFDGATAFTNFTATADDGRPRYRGPIAILIDARCISAGEGWTSWFVAQDRAVLFGEATAGASARKTEYALPCGRYRVRYPVRPYRGFLDRWIERRGIEPDVPVMPNARDIAGRRDTVLEAAVRYLDTGQLPRRSTNGQ